MPQKIDPLYINSSACTWIFKAPLYKLVKVSFKLNTLSKPESYFVIRDGRNKSHAILKTFSSKTNVSGSWTSSGRYLWVESGVPGPKSLSCSFYDKPEGNY